jgi:hypothetical protein
MSNRKTRVDNGFLIASAPYHIGEALGATRIDFEENSSLIHPKRKMSLDFFRELCRRVAVCLTKFYRSVYHTSGKGLH